MSKKKTILKIVYQKLSNEYEIIFKDEGTGEIEHEFWVGLPLRYRVWRWRHRRTRRKYWFSTEWTTEKKGEPTT